MSRARMTPTDYRASVVAVPPIALDEDLEPAHEPNAKLIRHIESGGVKSMLFGGNANLYNFDLGRYGGALALMDATASPSTHVITSVGPDFGKLTDQLPLVERSAIRNVMLLPMTFPVDFDRAGSRHSFRRRPPRLRDHPLHQAGQLHFG